jgi:hypothetical protein
MNIKLEPHALYKKAIYKVGRNNRLTYAYDKLIEVCMEENDFSYEDAVEWVDYNITGLSPMGFSIHYGDLPGDWKPVPVDAAGRPLRARVKKVK